MAILDQNGNILPGSNPFGPSPIPGCLVQVVKVGANGLADLPNLDGTPGSDDTVVFTTAIGQGIPTNQTVSGRFSTAISSPPADGTKIYARVFNGTNVASSTYWGQSATFTISTPRTNMEVSILGLKMTTMPIGVVLTNTVDSKGLTYYQELIANTNPKNPTDFLKATSFVVGSTAQASFTGSTGRNYILQRATNELNAATWTDIDTTGLLAADGAHTLIDPSPPSGPKAFYRIKVTMP